jgi:NAD(P)-dependent dehydrogenase (short-subunit alcohol dehydrogenase family)
MGSHTDFTSMEVYRKSMDVNYFGMIHVTKAFLPLVKASPSDFKRILNVCSIAGRMSSHSTGAYSASKFAAEAFTIALRQEMKEWGIKVIMYEPGFHGTALLSLFKSNLVKCYENCPESTKAEYGPVYVEKQLKSFDWMKQICVNHPEAVVLKLVEGTLSKFPVSRYVVGLDAKYLFAPTITILPDPVLDFVLSLILNLPKPLAVQKRQARSVNAEPTPVNPSS